jgi:mRNA interferase MazF
MSTLNMLRDQIWLYDPNPSVGEEIGKIRPAIIVNNDAVGVLRLKIQIRVLLHQ